MIVPGNTHAESSSVGNDDDFEVGGKTLSVIGGGVYCAPFATVDDLIKNRWILNLVVVPIVVCCSDDVLSTFDNRDHVAVLPSCFVRKVSDILNNR